MSKKATTIITLSVLLLALAAPCVWLALVNRQKGLDKALFEAARNGTGEDVKRAIEAGGRVEASDVDLGPIHIPIPMLGENPTIHDALLHLNIQSFPKNDYPHFASGEYPIHRAAEFGNAQAVKVLLDFGASNKAKDKYKRTPLHFAAASNNSDAVQSLLDNGSDIDTGDDRFRRPIHYAVNAYFDAENKEQSKKIITLLIRAGTKIPLSDVKRTVITERNLCGFPVPESADENIGSPPHHEP